MKFCKIDVATFLLWQQICGINHGAGSFVRARAVCSVAGWLDRNGCAYNGRLSTRRLLLQVLRKFDSVLLAGDFRVVHVVAYTVSDKKFD